MSGILKKITDHKKRVVMMFLLLAVTAVFLIFKLYILAAFLIVVVAVNELTVRKMSKRIAPFSTRSRIRNVDTLVIGETDSVCAKTAAKQGTSVEICLPGCTLAGAYEVLRHTFSILKESGGNAVLAVKKKNIGKIGYSLFDIGFFHVVTMNRLGLKNVRLMSHFPIVFAPVKSLRFLLGIGNKRNADEYCDDNIMRFCSERDIEVKILQF